MKKMLVSVIVSISLLILILSRANVYNDTLNEDDIQSENVNLEVETNDSIEIVSEESNENLTSEESKVINQVDYFDYENSIELRDKKLWLNKRELDKLVLDGEIYDINMEVINSNDFSHVSINYPLIIIGFIEVYDLEKEIKLITQSLITKELEEVFNLENTTYGDIQFTAEDFVYIDYAQYSENLELVCISIHSFHADVEDSIICTYDLRSNEIKFNSRITPGRITNIIFSNNTRKIAYSYSDGCDNIQYHIDIIDAMTMEDIRSVDLYKFLKDKVEYQNIEKSDINLNDIFWKEEKLMADIDVKKTNNSKSETENIKLELWINK